MAALIYTSITSLDGYVVDEAGRFDWCAPDEEVHAFVNEIERPIGTYLYGRRLYETMVFWETALETEQSPVVADYARLWRAAEKIVFSRTLSAVGSARTRLERDFSIDAIRAMKSQARRDLGVGGAELAGQALRGGLVDRVRLVTAPVIVGGGRRALPDGLKLRLELTEQRRFGNGTVYAAYDVTSLGL